MIVSQDPTERWGAAAPSGRRAAPHRPPHRCLQRGLDCELGAGRRRGPRLVSGPGPAGPGPLGMRISAPWRMMSRLSSTPSATDHL